MAQTRSLCWCCMHLLVLVVVDSLLATATTALPSTDATLLSTTSSEDSTRYEVRDNRALPLDVGVAAGQGAGQEWDGTFWGEQPANADPATVMLYKFSDNKDYLTSEEFLELAQCTLAHDSCPEFEDEAVAAFSVLSNCSSNPQLKKLECDAFHQCLSHSELLQLATAGGNPQVGVASLRKLLPLLLAQAQQPLCRGINLASTYDMATTDDINPDNKKPTSLEVWGYGMLFVTLISVCSLVGVSVMPLIARKLYQQLLTSLIGLAAGSLAASAVFHLLPQAFRLPELYGNHDYLFTSLYVLLGLWAFLMIERIIKMSITVHVRRHSEKPAPSGHSHQEVDYHPGESSVIGTVAWMIIFGDGFHNFLDGVSIGAAFSQSKMTGISISLAVMCEELPHELGDFAVLLNAGMSMRQALMYNFLSATTCYMGLVIGILLGEFTQDASYIFALAAGMFLYISCVDMVPELNEVINTAIEKGTTKDVLWTLLLQNIGLFLGVFSLFTLAYFQDDIVFN